MPSASDQRDSEQDLLEPIAVVGFSLRLPQDAVSPASFWRMLEERRCSMTDWPRERMNIDAFHRPGRNGKNKIIARGGHFLAEDPEIFDASFFSITATEAMAMDCQQRILLETAYRALENAGIPMERVLGSRTGVYTGSMSDAYKLLLIRDDDAIPKYAATGLCFNLLANRISWFFDFTGPSVNLDSACSSSLMALDVACQGLRNGDSSMAIVAGSNLVVGVEGSVSLSSMSFLSPDSKCFTFDDRANGYSRGEGVGVVVLKRLSDAVADGDTIRAVIRATGSNQDGHTPGITQPSKESQAVLIKQTYKRAGLSFAPTRYFEAHGTGTAIGDPIEADAIGSVFREYRSTEDPLYLGALKANIGHLEGGAGIAGLIKAIMVLEKGVIPPNANFERLNPRIDAEFLNLEFPLTSIPWPAPGLRRVSVNSFGFGGSNSHAVVDDAFHFLNSRGIVAHHNTLEMPPLLTASSTNGALINGCNGHYANGVNGHADEEGAPMYDESSRTIVNGIGPSQPRVLVWSGFDESATIRTTTSFAEYLATVPSPSKDYLDALGYTLGSRRSAFPWRSFAVLHSPHSLKCLDTLVSKPVRSSKNTGIAFVFTGQGAQYKKMGIDLLRYPIFKQTLQTFDSFLKACGCGWSVIDVLADEHDGTYDIDAPEYSQPLSTALQIALVELLRSFALSPSAVVGHSSGEIAAAYAAGCLSLQSACKVAYFRGKFASKLVKETHLPGAMLAVNLSDLEARSYIASSKLLHSDHISVACINSPSNVTLSGPDILMDALKDALDLDGIFCRKVKTGVAYHSPQMQAIADQYLASIQDIKPGTPPSPKISMISSVTGDYVTNLAVPSQPGYWIKNMVQPVRFSEALTRLISETKLKRKLGAPIRKAVYDVVEIGPHAALQRPVKQILEYINRSYEVRYTSALSRFRSALDTTLELAGRLWTLGYPVDLDSVNQIPESALATKAPPSKKVLTDLPEYPFSRAQKYCGEGRLSKNLRLRPHPALTLLGTSVPDFNPLEAKWRRSLSIDDIPWLADHKVNGAIIFPAAGMAVMALEAVAQMIGIPDRPVAGLYVKEAQFSNAIAISSDEDQKTETELYLRPLRKSFEKESTWFEARLYVLENGQWVQACLATIQVRYKTTQLEVNGNYFDSQWIRHQQREYNESLSLCNQPVDTKQLYQTFTKMGLGYGPSFSTLQNLAWNGEDRAVAQIRQTVVEPSLQNELFDHILHPTVLDAAAQLMWVSLTRGGTMVPPTGIPTKIRDAWFSLSGPTFGTGEVLYACSESKFVGLRGTHGSMVVVDAEGNVKLSIPHMENTMVASQASTSSTDSTVRRLCYSMDWKPDITLLSLGNDNGYINPDYSSDVEQRAFYQELGPMLMVFVKRALSELTDDDYQQAEPHLKKYVDWMKLIDSKFEKGNLPHADQDWRMWLTTSTDEVEALIDHVAAANARGKLFVTIGRNLVPIIRKTVNPMELMFATGLAEAYYENVFESIRFGDKLYNYIDALAHKNPSMKILELGSSTGGITRHVLTSLVLHGNQESGTPRFSEYTYTDISSSSFQKVEEKFAFVKDRMKFKVLDVQQELVDQGFKPGAYDLVIAASVLHSTKDLKATLRNIRKALKPGGQLLIQDITEPDLLRHGFAWGVLPGWWLGTEPYRKLGSCITDDQWNNVLSEAGFSGADFVIRDHKDDLCHESSFILATAVPDQPAPQPSSRAVVVADPRSPLQETLARCIQTELMSIGRIPCIVTTAEDLSELQHPEDSFFILLSDIDGTFLQNMDESRWELLRRILFTAKRLIWVTKGAQYLPSWPEKNLVVGFARVLRSEDINRSFVTLSLENPNVDEEASAKKIIKVLCASATSSSDDIETEYVEMNGLIHVNRVVEANHLDHDIHEQVSLQLSQRPFGQCPPLALEIGSPGVLDSLRFVEDAAHETQLGAHEIEIQVESVGLNFRDLFVALGRLDDPNIGCECAGIVTRIGSKCTLLKPGDRVCAAKIGSMRTFVRCDENVALQIPDSMPFDEAAAIPITSVTAYYALIEIARLQKGETVLIHAGSGGTGQMAIQLAQWVGAEVYATVGYDEKKKLLMERYNIPEDHIFYSRNTSFREGIMHMTKGKGVDVVLNSLAGDALIASWECVAPYGRFTEIGKSDIKANSKLPMSVFENNVSFSGVDIDHLLRHRPAYFGRQLKAVLELMANGSINLPFPLQKYPVSKMEEALRFLQGGKNTGKIVLSLGAEDLVPAFLVNKSAYRFRPDATYVIAGGLGGLGRSAAKWMMEKGAKNLLLLSRSGAASQAASSLVEELRSGGVNVEAPKCDIASAEALQAVLAECAKMMPPIRGCLQGTMVLQDSLFEKMTYTQWTTSLRSKVTTTQNLHTYLPHHLDFFIMLSSLSGIVGSISQSNYAAGNTYQDALAQHRILSGQKAVALNLGIMGSVGIIAETEAYRKNYEGAIDMLQVEENEFHALLDHYCDPGLVLDKGSHAQAMIGLATPNQLRARGIEPPAMMARPMFRALEQIDATATHVSVDNSSSGADLSSQFRNAATAADAAAVVVSGLVKKMAKALSMEEKDVDTGKPLSAWGVDSLLAVELRNWFAKEFVADVAIFDIMGVGSMTEVGNMVAAKSKGRKGGDE